MALKCQKCFRPLVDCQGCNGKPLRGHTCAKCRTTGLVCPTHQGHWSK
jgi:hypothetical protein